MSKPLDNFSGMFRSGIWYSGMIGGRQGLPLRIESSAVGYLAAAINASSAPAPGESKKSQRMTGGDFGPAEAGASRI